MRPAEPPSRQRIVLEIDPGSDPISGDVDSGRGTQRFTGWLELAAALHAALGAAEEKHGRPP